ncbi:sterile alpha motif (SAM) domain-containing protein [Abeliophyllum distichum]|uniref:Sterile alpha motif (SAM) domain-containing protein n=1 Tax=Abeliophyllum distichum TaxID=126358 RepID=A0ABD1TYU7_9LAMI
MISKITLYCPPLKPAHSRHLSNPIAQPPLVHRKSRKDKIPGRKIERKQIWRYGLDSIEPTLDLLKSKGSGGCFSNSNSIESKLLKLQSNSMYGACDSNGDVNEAVDREMGIKEEERFDEEEFLEEGGTRFDVLLKLCADGDELERDSVVDDFKFLEEENCGFESGSICCPLCGADISGLSDDLRQVHTNKCLDKVENSIDVSVPHSDADHQSPAEVLDGSSIQPPQKALDVSHVLEWLRNLGLAKYEDVFMREEIDWDTLQCLTDEDLCSIGITALGPRKKIVHALRELRKDVMMAVEVKTDVSKNVAGETKMGTNKLITDYFSGHFSERNRGGTTSNGQKEARRSQPRSAQRSMLGKSRVRNGKQKDIPLWCCIPGTPFRVDAFKYLRRECSHWFLTHFHLDHYQGLTRSFCHGIIYCSSITAKLINLKIGIPWDKIQVLPLNQKISVAGIDVTCFDANHCPGAIIVLFEPPNGKAVLHTGDFRFCEEMAKLSMLQTSPVYTLILDTTYCDPQYDFPKQEAIIQFVIDAIQAEDFNPKTLFLIGSYTIGKERLFMEVARALRKKVYVNAAKLRLLKCLDLPEEDMQWFTTNEMESHIHVVPMWTIASFKRLKHMSSQYGSRFSLVVAFSPTGWSFGKGKKKSPGRRWQQGTIIRYEVPYSEHSSFTELQEFVKFISPIDIIPSVNNNGPDSHNAMISQLLAKAADDTHEMTQIH